MNNDRRRIFEISAAVLTGLGKILVADIFHQPLIFIISASLSWIIYALVRIKQDYSILQIWGFTGKSFKTAFKRLFPFFLIVVATCFIVGWIQDSMIFNWHMLILLIFYPFWGVIQQFLVIGLIAGNLSDQRRWNISKTLIVLTTATLFSIVHYPSLLLILGTFLLAVVYSLEYLKHRNLWALGIYHGWLACFYYYWVLERDPFVEVFGIFLQ